MKLPSATQTSEQKLQEFDIWITPSLGDIRESPQFRDKLASIVRALDRLCAAADDFASEEDLDHSRLADNLVEQFAGKTPDEVKQILLDLASVLFLITGKSDNNAKCQLPIFLRDELKRETLPKGKTSRRRGQETHQVVHEAPPRVIDTEKYMGWVAGLHHSPAHQRELIDIFLQYILDESSYLAQLWSFGRSYATLKALSRAEALLSPLIVVQVRGSVAATGGHEPENILRQLMTEWGLVEGTDFNAADVRLNDELHIAKEVVQEGKKVKTRAYDFAMPYRVAGRMQNVLIQSQYYAGDSGSVSHKNVDQTTAARREAKRSVGDDARFVEYVDGAGFFASLNGDLKSLLDMPDTASYIQLRSTPIRLRRELQAAGFLTPIEVEHAILAVGTLRADVTSALARDGYRTEEIERAIHEALAHGFMAQPAADQIAIDPARLPQARRYLLLDLAAIRGTTLTKEQSTESGYVLVPGYGPFHGIKATELFDVAKQVAPLLETDYADEAAFRGDLDWLAERGYAMVNP